MTESDLVIERERVEDAGDILFLALNRPEKINALTQAMLNRMNAALDEAERDDSIRVVVVYGRGPRGFCSGLDRAEMNDYAAPTPQTRANVAEMYRTAKRLDLFPKPVVSLVHGHCIGAGTQIAMAADVIIAAKGARISEPEMRMGGFADDDWLRRIGHLLGAVRAKRYLLLKEPLSGQEAESLGMVSLLAADDDLLATGRRVASEIAQMRPAIVERSLRLIDDGATGAPRAIFLAGRS
ncbi:MAG: enoyl-CoA hydratase/isomerase family protein [Dehalococcoidia bacterium]